MEKITSKTDYNYYLNRQSEFLTVKFFSPAQGMDVCLLCLYVVLSCVGRGLFDGLITRPEESYRVSLYVCDQETPKREAKGPSWTISAFE
jgi:hypothetical protein